MAFTNSWMSVSCATTLAVPAALGAIIQATCDFLTRAHSGGACDRQTAFEPLMDAAIVRAIRRLLMEGMQRAQHPLGVPPELVAAAASAAICGGVKQWFSMPDRPPAKVIVAQMLELILPMLEAGLKAESPVAAAANPHRIVTRPSETGREKRRGPALPGFM